jgi:hypothetical protein
MRNMLTFVLLINLLIPTAWSAGITMEECNTTVAEFNDSLPMQLDGITTWVNTSCVDLGNNEIQLVYENRVTDGNNITQTELDAVLPSVLMSWCFGPTLSPLMQVVDTINYQYHFENGEHIGELNFSFAECLAQQ